jgi:4-amino-4-deoxy-L-arabinose transferase-like glycosyltransferase
MNGPRDVLGLGAIVAAGFLIRLGFLRTHQTIERDGVLYASVAEHLAEWGRLVDLRGTPHTFYPPAYPALIAPVYLVVGDSHRAGQIVSLLAGTTLIALVFLLGRRVGGRPVGLIAAALAAIYPPLAHAAVSVHTESTYAVLLCLVLLVGRELVEQPGVKASLLAGGLVGAMYLTRPEGLLLAAVFAWALATWIVRREPGRRVIARAVAFGVALAVLVVPYVVYLRETTGTWALTGKVASYRVAESPEAREAVKFGPARARPWRGLRTEVPLFAERYLRNFVRQEGVIVESVSLLAVMLAGVGLAAATPWRTGLAVEGVLLAAVLPLLLYPAFEVVARWTEPYMVVLFVYCARGIGWIAGRARTPRPAPAIAAALVLLLAVRYAPQLAIPLRYTAAFEPVEQRAAGLWIRERFGSGSSVMCRVPEIAYYARARWVPLPYADIRGLVDAARRERATFLVIDEPHTRGLRPELMPLLDGVAPPGLALIHETDEFPGRRVRVFAVEPA